MQKAVEVQVKYHLNAVDSKSGAINIENHWQPCSLCQCHANIQCASCCIYLRANNITPSHLPMTLKVAPRDGKTICLAMAEERYRRGEHTKLKCTTYTNAGSAVVTTCRSFRQKYWLQTVQFDTVQLRLSISCHINTELACLPVMHA